MTVRELFDFVTDPSITCHNIDQYLDKVGARDTASSKLPNDIANVAACAV